MQITLNQAEIEQAIKNYVNDQVNIREGHDIAIDLKAGRGPEGFTATIDIVGDVATKPIQPAAASKPVATPKPRAERTVAAQEAAEEAAPEAAPTTQAEPEKAQDGAASEDKQETEKPKSLFANLGKPKN